MSEPLTEERIAEIQQRCERATKGPWTVARDDGEMICDVPEIDIRLNGSRWHKVVDSLWLEPCDAEFIAHARADLPALLADRQRLHSQLTEAQQRIQALEQARERLIAQWRAKAREADALVRRYDRGGDHAGNAFAFLKERRIWTTCADELAAVAAPPDPTE
jgi:hypothetical protein